MSVQNIWYDYFGTEDIIVGIFNSDDDAGRGGHALYEDLWAGKLAFNDFVPTESAGGITDPTRFINTVLETNPDLVIASTDFPEPSPSRQLSPPPAMKARWPTT